MGKRQQVGERGRSNERKFEGTGSEGSRSGSRAKGIKSEREGEERSLGRVRQNEEKSKREERKAEAEREEKIKVEIMVSEMGFTIEEVTEAKTCSKQK